MVSSNQRSIYQGIQKVVGSSNRGFISLDPERQARITTQPKASTAAASGDFRPPPSRPASTAGSGRR